MKKYIIHIIVCLSLIIGCEQEDIVPGGTKTNALSGEWFVNHNHSVYGIDPFEKGYLRIITANTASDDGSQMVLTDEGHFQDGLTYRVKVNINETDLSFGSNDTLINYSEKVNIDTIPIADSTGDYEIPPEYLNNNKDSLVISRYRRALVRNGQIYKDAVDYLESGVISDSIYYEIWFENLEDETAIENDTLQVSGYRRTGFLEDDH